MGHAFYYLYWWLYIKEKEEKEYLEGTLRKTTNLDWSRDDFGKDHVIKITFDENDDPVVTVNYKPAPPVVYIHNITIKVTDRGNEWWFKVKTEWSWVVAQNSSRSTKLIIINSHQSNCYRLIFSCSVTYAEGIAGPHSSIDDHEADVFADYIEKISVIPNIGDCYHKTKIIKTQGKSPKSKDKESPDKDKKNKKHTPPEGKPDLIVLGGSAFHPL